MNQETEQERFSSLYAAALSYLKWAREATSPEEREMHIAAAMSALARRHK